MSGSVTRRRPTGIRRSSSDFGPRVPSACAIQSDCSTDPLAHGLKTTRSERVAFGARTPKRPALDGTAAADRITALEEEHGERRRWVWAGLGEAPLADASEHLAALATFTRKVLPAESVSRMVDAYVDGGWRADDAVMRALGATTTQQDRDLVTGAIRAIYCSWLDAGARRFQDAVGGSAADYLVEWLTDWTAGTCLIFVDGLRFDVGKRVEAALLVKNLAATIRPRLVALPTITSTAKPAVSPVAARLGPGAGLAPAPKDGGPDLAISGLRSLLVADGYQVLSDSDIGDPQGRAWTEHGDIDELGHKQQAKLPQLLDPEVASLVSVPLGSSKPAGSRW